MSCSGDGFGYITIEDDKVVSYTGAPEDPEIHKFCNDEIVQAVKLKKAIDTSIIALEKEIKYFHEHNQGYHHQETWIGLLHQLIEESKK